MADIRATSSLRNAATPPCGCFRTDKSLMIQSVSVRQTHIHAKLTTTRHCRYMPEEKIGAAHTPSHTAPRWVHIRNKIATFEHDIPSRLAVVLHVVLKFFCSRTRKRAIPPSSLLRGPTGPAVPCVANWRAERIHPRSLVLERCRPLLASADLVVRSAEDLVLETSFRRRSKWQYACKFT